jgi:uncharacterized protein YacL
MAMEKALEKADTLATATLEQLSEFAKKGVGFIESQAPELCREIIILGRAQYTAYIVIAIAVSVVGVAMYRYARKVANTCEWQDYRIKFVEVQAIATGIIGLILNLVAAAVFLGNLMPLLTVWFAPRVYIIQYLATLTGH